MSDIDEFLRLQSQDGSFDSSGVFTVDQVGQLAKIQSKLLANETQALLKIVQAMVGWRCSSMQIDHCSQELSIYADCPDLDPLKEIVSQNIGDLLSLLDSPQTDLILGLAYFMKANPERVFFSFWNNGRVTQLGHWLGQDQDFKLRRPPDAWKDGCGIHIQFPASVSGTPIKFDESEFGRRVFYCPCFIYLQKQLLGIKAFRSLLGPTTEETFMTEEALDSQWFLECFFQCRSGPNTIWPRPLDRTENNLSPHVKWPTKTFELSKETDKSKFRIFLTPGGRSDALYLNRSKPLSWLGHITQSPFSWDLPTCNAAVVVRDFKPCQAVYLYVIKRGVLVERLTATSLEHPIGNASVVLPDDDCPTDLSQFSVQRGPVITELEDRAKIYLAAALKVCAQRPAAVEAASEGHSYSKGEKTALAVSTLGITSISCLASMSLTGLGALPAALVGGAIVMHYVHRFRFGDLEDLENRQLVQNWVDSLEGSSEPQTIESQ